MALINPENTLHQKLCEQVGLCPAPADKALEIFLEHARINYDESRPPGQTLRTVVSAAEPAGKPIKHCQTLEVRLTVDHRLDAEIQRLHDMGRCAGRRSCACAGRPMSKAACCRTRTSPRSSVWIRAASSGW